MTNFKNNFYDSITNKRSIPYSAATTGTVTSTGVNVVGTGTLFIAECPPGSWFVDLAANEVRKVKSVISDTRLVLEEAFTVDLAAVATPQVIHAKEMKAVEIEVFIPLVVAPGGANNAFGVIDGIAFPSGYVRKLSKSSKGESKRSTIDPIIVDASATVMTVSILY